MSDPREKNFVRDVEEAFAPELIGGTLRLARDEYSAASFGNAAVVLEGQGFLLLLQRERGIPYALVASSRAPADWERLQAVVKAITGTDVAGAVEIEWELSPAEAALLFRKNRGALDSAYRGWWAWRATRKQIARVRKLQQRTLDAWLASPEADAALEADNRAAQRELANPSEDLKAALKSLHLDDTK